MRNEGLRTRLFDYFSSFKLNIWFTWKLETFLPFFVFEIFLRVFSTLLSVRSYIKIRWILHKLRVFEYFIQTRWVISPKSRWKKLLWTSSLFFANFWISVHWSRMGSVGSFGGSEDFSNSSLRTSAGDFIRKPEINSNFRGLSIFFSKIKTALLLWFCRRGMHLFMSF